MFIITVIDSVVPEYKFIRDDKWGTPVRTHDFSTAKVFDNREAAEAYIIGFQLGKTYHKHEIVSLSSNFGLDGSKIVAETSYQNNGKGNFLVAIHKVK